MFPGVTRATQHELVPMRHTYVTRACNAVLTHKRNVKETLVKSPETCQHVNTDARGSSSATHRVYCRDCGQYVYECPQSEWRQEQNEIWGNLLRGRTERIDFSRGGERVHESRSKRTHPQFPSSVAFVLAATSR